VILLCVGAPKQEILMTELCTNSACLIAGVGAVYDFIATPNAQAPNWMSKVGIEWCYRLIKNPKRMWKRTLISAPIFLLFH
jgi:N-acetylglucosaminyldiphosphoundecaprenol N-acetyl-beta-D-mannosaminyltransferase